MILAVVYSWLGGCATRSPQELENKPGLLLTLRTAKETIAVGTNPAFRLRIENVGKTSEKILWPRGDLQDTYYELEVIKDGKALH
jgi:hypothetical protein